MSKRIVLDLTKCEGCESCSVRCGYFYRPHDADQVIQTLKTIDTGIVLDPRVRYD